MFATFPPRYFRLAALLVLLRSLVVNTVVAEDRVLTFPEDRSVGMVSVGQPPTRESGFLSISRDFKTIGPARGTVRISDESFIHLDLNSANAGDLSFLRQLPPDSIQSLLVERMPVDRRAMIDIARQQSLVLVIFRNCRFTSDAFEDVPPLPQLLELRFLDSTAGLVDGDVPDAKANDVPRADWIAGSKRLEYLHCTPALSTQIYKRLRNHPSLAFVNVRIGADAEELLSSLREMPSLRGLDVSVSAEGQLKDLGELKWPVKVETYNWSGDRIDANLLRSLSPENHLRRLRFENVILGRDFPAGLRELTSLEELVLEDLINDGHAIPILNELPEVLASLPGLKSWPLLRHVDSETWDLICATERIENLEISGVADDVSEDDLLKLSRLKNLRSLYLQNVPLGDAGLESFSSMHDLENLVLTNTKVTGRGFRALGGLKKLLGVDIWFDPKVIPTLKELAKLPALESLRIWKGIQLQPADLLTLSDCKTLLDLTLFDCPVDDSTAEWLGQMPNLRQLDLSFGIADSSSMSDSGLRSLSRSRSLQKLSVAGFFTRDGVAALTRIPSLRSLSLYVHGYSRKSLKTGPRDFHQKLRTIPSVEIRDYCSDLTIGRDGLYRDGDEGERAALDSLESKPAPALVSEAANTFGEGTWKLDDLRGQVVLVDFWGTWCGPCVQSIPSLTRLYAKYHEQGLCIVGVHTRRGAKELPTFLKARPLPWPTVVDVNGKLVADYHVPFYPCVYLIDRRGVLRVAGVHKLGLEDAVRKLLEEPVEGGK